MAKLVNCKVNLFSIGFGTPIIKKEIGGTIYQITLFPIGGKCDLKGELEYSEDDDAFLNLSLTKKILISIAGITVNIVLGIVTFLLGFHYRNVPLMFFGGLSGILGITNLIPTFPCLDGSYLIYYPIIIKKFGKIEGIKIIKLIVHISLKIAIILNILSVPLLIWMFINGVFNVSY
jgi:hypothetical protein